jgi:hypothetical protein
MMADNCDRQRILFMLSPNSPELMIENGLREIECSARNFTEIARLLHVRMISRTALADALAGNAKLDERTAQQLLDLLDELRKVRTMFALPSPVPLPFDWSRWEAVSTFVLAVRLKQIEKEQALQQVVANQ